MKHCWVHSNHNNRQGIHYLPPSHINNKIQSRLYLMCMCDFFFFSEGICDTLKIMECSFDRVTFLKLQTLPRSSEQLELIYN